MCSEGPDDGHVDGDDDDGPDGVVGQPHEVGDGTEAGDDHADGAGEHVAGEDPDARQEHDDADKFIAIPINRMRKCMETL